MALKNLDKIKARIAALPASIQAASQAQLDKESDALAEAIKDNAPTSVLEEQAGDLKASVHKEPGRRPLSYTITADARDAKGKQFAVHVEFGHLNAKGGHVPAKPFLFPTYRALKKGMRRRMVTAGRKAARAVFDG